MGNKIDNDTAVWPTMSIIRDEMGCFHLFPRAIIHRALISGRF
ncbi:hypothetical protein [Alloprevotella tannerae]|nr:hypothetical protein [Alloprevotella tannerae]